MKFNKFFMLGLAGLAFAACSNEEVENSLPQGTGAVTVQIVSPSVNTRTVAGTTEMAGDDKVTVSGSITLRLTTSAGPGEPITLEAGTTSYTFWNVQSPTKIEAWVNDGDKVNSATSITAEEPNMQALPENIPAYGSEINFTLSGKTTHDDKTYDMYKATVVMEIPVARLEVSGITHIDNDGTTCEYKTLTIDGIYLDNILPTKGGNLTDYFYPATEGTAPAPILWEAITSESFLTADAKWPSAQGQVYAFNFYPATQVPVLKLYFANAEAKTGTMGAPRYAMVKSYNGDAKFNFVAGKIYRITEVNLADGNIIGDEGGNTLYGVDVTVTEAKWDVVDLENTQWVSK